MPPAPVVAALWASDRPLRELAAEHGVSRWTLRNWAKQLELGPRRRGAKAGQLTPKQQLALHQGRRRSHLLRRVQPTPRLAAAAYRCPRCHGVSAYPEGHEECLACQGLKITQRWVMVGP